MALRPSVAVLACLLTACPVLSQQKTSAVAGDNSDWWSDLTRGGTINLSAMQANAQHRELEPSMLEVATIRVGLGEIQRAAAKLGTAKVMTRGDGADTRFQACYVSSDADTHLIFQVDGEGFGAALYLFKGGPDWNGSSFCAKSPLVSPNIGTASGLRLGLSRSQVETLLGKPSKDMPDELVYDLEVKRKTPASKLIRLRQQNPNLSEADFHDSFDFYYSSSYVETRFDASSKLVYVAMTTEETYP
jgi:hypothetical protein